MRILGIDPGYAIIGYGILEYDGARFQTVAFGAITTPAGKPFTERLDIIYRDMCTVLDTYRPDCMGIEKLFFNTNEKTAINVAQARGVILLALKKNGVPIFEYTPLQIKQALTGYGRAEKKQVQEMMRIMLRLDKVPKPDDTADALAMAICHAHTSGSLVGKLKKYY